MNNEMPEKLSRTILSLKELNIKIHVKLTDNFYFHNEYIYENKKYTRLEPMVFLSIDLPKNESGFNPNRGLTITEANIGVMIKRMNRLINNIYNEKIFGMRDNEIIVYADAAKSYTEKFILPKTNQVVVLQPTVVYDENEISYEGIRMYFNVMENSIDLSIDEFESIIYTLSHIDLFQYSQLLINYMILKYPDTKDEENNKPKYNRSYNRIDWNVPAESTAHSNFRKSSDNILFEGLEDASEI